MSHQIALFYHCVFFLGDPPELSPHAVGIVSSQMDILRTSGLLDIASEVYVGINGAEESQVFADGIIPEKAVKVYHGTQCKNENRTIMLMQHMMRGRKDWYSLYFHSKGASSQLTNEMSYHWRSCMNHYLVQNWDTCIMALKNGADSCGCHWKTGQVNGKQSLWAGNFFWVKSEFLNTLPPIEDNKRIPLMGGLDAFESRYEAEILIGEGPRLPRVIDFHPTGPWTCGGIDRRP